MSEERHVCAMCGTDAVEYVKHDCIKLNPFNHCNNWHNQTFYYCRECALHFCYDYAGIKKICNGCHREFDRERMTRDCDGKYFCSVECMLAGWKFKPIEKEG